MGSIDVLISYIDIVLKKASPSISEDTIKCMRLPMITSLFDSEEDSPFDLEEKDFKKVIDEYSVTGLSGWAIFAIVIGCIAGVGLIGAAVYFFWYKKRSTGSEMASSAAGPLM